MYKKLIFEFLYKNYSRCVGSLPDRHAISLHFFLRVGYWPNLDYPITFNEKIQYRKLRGDHNVYSKFADKICVKNYVRDVLGENFIIPSLWIGKTLPPVEKWDWELPCVIKMNFGSGYNIFLKHDSDISFESINKQIYKWMNAKKKNSHLKEHFYDLIERSILVEPFLGDNIPDYKFYVFNGKVYCIHVDTNRFVSHKRCFFSPDWTPLPFTLKYPLEDKYISPPSHFDIMLTAAETLGSDFDFVRIDFYDTLDGPKFGEMTFTPGGGYEKFSDIKYDHILGSLWK